MKAKLINIGRLHVTKEIEVRGDFPLEDAETECRKYLMSKDVEMLKTSDPKVWTVAAGFHDVGRVEFAEPILTADV